MKREGFKRQIQKFKAESRFIICPAGYDTLTSMVSFMSDLHEVAQTNKQTKTPCHPKGEFTVTKKKYTHTHIYFIIMIETREDKWQINEINDYHLSRTYYVSATSHNFHYSIPRKLRLISLPTLPFADVKMRSEEIKKYEAKTTNTW